MTQSMNKTERASAPWWKYGHVWLVLAGPAIVVVAGIVTALIAMDGADPVVDPNYYQEGLNINKRLEKSLAPAGSVRNHVLTPDDDLPDLRPR